MLFNSSNNSYKSASYLCISTSNSCYLNSSNNCYFSSSNNSFVNSSNFTYTKLTGILDYNNLINKPTYSVVATTGSYTDLINKVVAYAPVYMYNNNTTIQLRYNTTQFEVDTTNGWFQIKDAIINPLPVGWTVSGTTTYTMNNVGIFTQAEPSIYPLYNYALKVGGHTKLLGKLEVVSGDIFLTGNFTIYGNQSKIYFQNDPYNYQNYWEIYESRDNSFPQQSLIFHHVVYTTYVDVPTTNSYWYFNGTYTATNSQISDDRIKKDIQEIERPLEQLMKLKPKQFYLCDDKDYNIKFGFIAQEVEEELQEFVFTDTEYIANIFCIGTHHNKIIKTEKDISNLIEINDEIKLVFDNNGSHKEFAIDDSSYNNRYKKRYVKVIKIIDAYNFEIENKLDLNENFLIYGKKVNDFKKLDYNSLYSLNIACSQELYKIIQKQQEQINDLTDKINKLINNK